jgi:hypothetical protein
VGTRSVRHTSDKWSTQGVLTSSSAWATVSVVLKPFKLMPQVLWEECISTRAYGRLELSGSHNGVPSGKLVLMA